MTTILSMLHIPRWIFTTLWVLMLGVAAAAEPASETIHYWNGDSRVEVKLALDEAASLLPGKHGKPSIEGWTVSPLTAGDRPALAKSLAAETEHAVLYDGVARDVARRSFLSRRFSLCLHENHALEDVLRAHELTLVKVVPYSPRTWIVEAGDPLAALAAANALYESGKAVFAMPLIESMPEKRYTPNDPLLGQQWHLDMINASTAWDTVTGNGVNIVIVDDSLQHTHPDLSANARTDLDLDINGGDLDPSPVDLTTEHHGTWVGGVAGGRGDNNVGTSGVAYRSGLIGVRLISGLINDEDIATALNLQVSATNANDQAWVSNNSWGSAATQEVVVLPPLMKAALANGTTNGRSGRGVTYVWAAGNDGNSDFCSYDGFVGNRYTIGVGSVTSTGVKASYSETGCNVLVCAPGGSAATTTGIVTTDVVGNEGLSTGDYTAVADSLQGTSFAAPVVSGVAALVYAADPTLTWRDMMHVLARTAAKNDAGSPGWITNAGGASGLPYHQSYGFGLVQADAAVAAVAGGAWRPVPVSATALTASEQISVVIPDNDVTGITRTLSIAAPARFRAEHVELTISASHAWRGDLSFELTAPSGTKSTITQRGGDSTDNFSNLLVTSVATWGESPNGTWSLQVVDHQAIDVGTLTRWSLKVYGYIAPSAPVLVDIDPLYILTGSPDTVISLTGSHFDRWCEVEVDGTPVTTTFVNSTQLQATIPSGMLTADGPLLVTVVSDGFMGEGGGTSAGIVVTVSPPFAPYFIIDPTNAATFEPLGASFTARAVGLPEPTYTWERADPGSIIWNAVPGASGRALAIAKTEEALDDQSMYRCVATNGSGSATSASATLAVSGRLFGNGGGGGGGPCGGGGLGIGLILAGLTLVGGRRRRW